MVHRVGIPECGLQDHLNPIINGAIRLGGKRSVPQLICEVRVHPRLTGGQVLLVPKVRSSSSYCRTGARGSGGIADHTDSHSGPPIIAASRRFLRRCGSNHKLRSFCAPFVSSEFLRARHSQINPQVQYEVQYERAGRRRVKGSLTLGICVIKLMTHLLPCKL
jgi:hypothetical protein